MSRLKALAARIRDFVCLVVAVGSSTCVGCSRPESAAREPQTEGHEAPTNPQQETAQNASDVDLATELGADIVEIISTADTVVFADLTLVPADEALDPSRWRDTQRIAGYPIAGELRRMEATDARALRESVLNGGNYDPDWSWRCLMERAIGFRFVRGAARVDAALTDPCWLLIWTFERNEKPARWSAAFSQPDTERIYRLVNREGGSLH